ncbi:hypothetical protein JW752_05615, partial [Candidatus Peregrinibacteria bacterium]|nr:hypothetical protein [Candidatus Peregrinibacteria bacterium]
MINANSKSHSCFVILNLFQNLINRPGYRGILKQVQDDEVGVQDDEVGVQDDEVGVQDDEVGV